MPDADINKLSHGHPDHELLSALEPDQLVGASSRPLPRYVLGRAASLALWLLRGFVLVITALVIYTFVVSLQQRDQLLDAFEGESLYLSARAHAARQSDAPDAWIVDDQACLVIGSEQVGVAAWRRSSFLPHLLERERIAARFRNASPSRRSRHQVGRREPGQLIVGERPRLDLLAKDLLIHVTGFFRDPDVFAYLAESIIPDMVLGSVETPGRS